LAVAPASPGKQRDEMNRSKGGKMKTNSVYCPYDTHEKEIHCPYYEVGPRYKLKCDCKFMSVDRCYNLEYIDVAGKEE